MRGDRERQANIMLAVTPESFVPEDHPLRRIKPLVDDCLARLSPRFEDMYASRGRPSIPPEHLLKGSLLIALFSVRSERQFCERLRYDLLFKWFLDLNIADPEPFDTSTFSKNRERLARPRTWPAPSSARGGGRGRSRRRLLSAEHFSGGWDATGGVGVAEELPPARRAGAGRGLDRWSQPGGGLPGGAAQPGDARLAAPTPEALLFKQGGAARRRNSPTWGTCSPRTATGWWWTWS